MLIDQQQKPSETLQEYIQKFSVPLIKISGLLPHQAKDLAHIIHFIHNLHNQKLWHYMLGEIQLQSECHYPSSEKDAELCIIGGLNNHYLSTKLTIPLISNIKIKTVIQDPAIAVVAHI